MKFKKIYIEITNSCNFNCSFCFKTIRPPKFLSVDEFQFIVDKVRPYTDYIYLHVLGEPLLHPALDEILKIALSANLHVNITTNGALIARKSDILLGYPVRQINISLHDAEENLKIDYLNEYFDAIWNFTDRAVAKTYINLRLWNSGVAESYEFKRLCLQKICSKFNKSIHDLDQIKGNEGIKLAEHVFLQHAPRFDWPDGCTVRNDLTKRCYGLRDHVAILSNGDVVPCCIDADAAICLGNIFTDDFKKIISSERAQKIRNGFMNNTITEDFCRSCGFIIQR